MIVSPTMGDNFNFGNVCQPQLIFKKECQNNLKMDWFIIACQFCQINVIFIENVVNVDNT